MTSCLLRLCIFHTTSVHTDQASKLFKTSLRLDTFVCMLLQPLQWRCVDCVIHHERDVCQDNTIIDVARASNSKREIASKISIVDCCDGAKLCAHDARVSDRNNAML